MRAVHRLKQGIEQNFSKHQGSKQTRWLTEQSSQASHDLQEVIKTDAATLVIEAHGHRIQNFVGQRKTYGKEKKTIFVTDD